jgi:hypothetical protein
MNPKISVGSAFHKAPDAYLKKQNLAQAVAAQALKIPARPVEPYAFRPPAAADISIVKAVFVT